MSTVIEALRSIFPDEGAGLLADAEFSSWEQLLAQIPVDWLDVIPGSPEEQGEQLLINVREFFAQSNVFRPAIALSRALVRRRGATIGEDHPDTLAELGALGALADRAGRTQEAFQFLDQAYQGLRSAAGDRDLRLAVVANHFAWFYLRQGRVLEAERYLEHAVRIRREVAPATTGLLAAQLGELLVRRGVVDQALPYLWEAFDRCVEEFGAAHPKSVARARTLAAMLVAQSRVVEAIPVLRIVHQAAVREGQAEQAAATGFQLGCALEESGRREEAYRLVDDAVRWTREQPDHPDLANRLAALSRMVLVRGRPVEAEGLMLEALELDRDAYGDDSAEVAARYVGLGLLARQVGRPRDAIGWLVPACSLLRSAVGDDHWQTRLGVETLVELWLDDAREAIAERKHGYAREVLFEALPLATEVLGDRHRLVTEIRRTGLV